MERAEHVKALMTAQCHRLKEAAERVGQPEQQLLDGSSGAHEATGSADGEVNNMVAQYKASIDSLMEDLMKYTTFELGGLAGCETRNKMKTLYDTIDAAESPGKKFRIMRGIECLYYTMKDFKKCSDLEKKMDRMVSEVVLRVLALSNPLLVI